MAAVGGEHLAIGGAGSTVVAHIGGIPVEEWAPFVVPALALFIYVRRKDRRRRRAVARLPESSATLDADTVRQVLEAWAAEGYRDVGEAQLALLYPPGPDGMSVAELAARTNTPAADVDRLLAKLEEGEYLTLEEGEEAAGARALLTLKGYGLVHATEDALVGAIASAEDGARAERPRLDSNQQPPA